jgi:hypothetical protein
LHVAGATGCGGTRDRLDISGRSSMTKADLVEAVERTNRRESAAGRARG